MCDCCTCLLLKRFWCSGAFAHVYESRSVCWSLISLQASKPILRLFHLNDVQRSKQLAFISVSKWFVSLFSQCWLVTVISHKASSHLANTVLEANISRRQRLSSRSLIQIMNGEEVCPSNDLWVLMRLWNMPKTLQINSLMWDKVKKNIVSHSCKI